MKISKLPATIGLLCCVFFSWGFLTAMNGVLIPFMQQAFELSYTEAMYIQVVFSASPFFVSLPAAGMVNRLGYKRSLVYSLLLIAFGALMFVPATSMVSFPLVLCAVLVLAVGVGAIQVVANPFMANIGSASRAASRLTMAQGINSVGTTIAPYLGAVLLFSASSVDLKGSAELVQLPYIAIAAALVVLALVIFFADIVEPDRAERSQDAREQGSLWQHRNLVLGTAAIFFYTGVESGLAVFMVSYLTDSSIAGIDVAVAGKMVSLYWAGAMVGRLAGSFVFLFINSRLLLVANSVGAMALVAVAMTNLNMTGAIALLAIGLCNSIMYPVLFSLSIAGVGSKVNKASGVLIMAGIGGAAIPFVQAVLADNLGLVSSLFVPVTGYMVILIYSLFGWKPVTAKERTFTGEAVGGEG